MNVAVVGATGVVGQTILALLEERRLPITALGAFASQQHPGGARFRDNRLDVQPTSDDGLRGFDVVFFAGGEDASERYAPPVLQRGAVVIDNSASFRMRSGVPLIVPEVNADAIRPEHRLFPVANCTAIVLSMALRPLRDAVGLQSVYVATYQAASGAGRAGLDELLAQERALAYGEAEPPATVFPRQLARNVVPQVGPIDDRGWTGEERKVRDETRKMLDLPSLQISITAVRVPVRTAHSEAVFFQTARPASAAQLAAAFEVAPGIVFHHDGIVTPREVEGDDKVHVARVRAAEVGSNDFSMWLVGDQLRKGAATNAVQILELLLAKRYISA